MLNTPSIDRFESKTLNPEQIELIAFNVGEFNFGIALTKIARVINNLFVGEDYSLDRNVEILDLYRLIAGVEIDEPTAMVIFISKGDRLYGIPLDNMPTLVSTPANRIRVLPDDFRASNPLGIASHIALVSAEDRSDSTLFILS